MPVLARIRLLFEIHDENGDDKLSKHEIEVRRRRWRRRIGAERELRALKYF